MLRTKMALMCRCIFQPAKDKIIEVNKWTNILFSVLKVFTANTPITQVSVS